FICATLEGDNRYHIFKSLNSTGVKLEPADEIRNFVFMHVPPAEQDDFDHDLWEPLENLFPDGAGGVDNRTFSAFFRDFLMREGRYVSRAVFEAFEDRYEATGIDPKALAAELNTHAGYYAVLRGEKADPSVGVERALAK